MIAEEELPEESVADEVGGTGIEDDASPVSYGIGDTQTAVVEGGNQERGNSRSSSNPYNFALPFLVTAVLYAVGWYVTGTGLAKKRSWLSKPVFNLFWNSVLIVSAIPSVAFGFYLIFRYSVPALRDVDFDFLYWHVEGSVVFGTTAMMHLLSRLRQYVGPLRVLKTRS